MVRIAEWSTATRQSKVVTAFLERSAFPAVAEEAAAEVLPRFARAVTKLLRRMWRSLRVPS